MIREEHGIQCMPCSSRVISEMQLEIHAMEQFDFVKSIIHSQLIQLFVSNFCDFLFTCLDA